MNSLHLEHARAYAAYRIEPRDLAPRERRSPGIGALLDAALARLRRRGEHAMAEVTEVAEQVVADAGQAVAEVGAAVAEVASERAA